MIYKYLLSEIYLLSPLDQVLALAGGLILLGLAFVALKARGTKFRASTGYRAPTSEDKDLRRLMDLWDKLPPVVRQQIIRQGEHFARQNEE